MRAELILVRHMHRACSVAVEVYITRRNFIRYSRNKVCKTLAINSIGCPCTNLLLEGAKRKWRNTTRSWDKDERLRSVVHVSSTKEIVVGS